MEAGERIREFRKNKGYSQTEFGKKIGYSQSFVGEIERGEVEASRDFLKKLNEVFGLSSDYILYGSPQEQAEVDLAEHPEGYAKKKEAMIIREPETKYQILPTATKKLIGHMIEILESDNEVMINALKTNIKAFLEAVRLKKKNDEDKSKGVG